MLDDWFYRWNISDEARADFYQSITKNIFPSPKLSGKATETLVQKRVRLDAANKGILLMRNNVGGFYDETGRFIRYGLANESKKMNKTFKSSDLIGIKPIKITKTHVGQTIGQFVARETKKENWKYTVTTRNEAQKKFILAVRAYGGDACFTTGEGSFNG